MPLTPTDIRSRLYNRGEALLGAYTRALRLNTSFSLDIALRTALAEI